YIVEQGAPVCRRLSPYLRRDHLRNGTVKVSPEILPYTSRFIGEYRLFECIDGQIDRYGYGSYPFSGGADRSPKAVYFVCRSEKRLDGINELTRDITGRVGVVEIVRAYVIPFFLSIRDDAVSNPSIGTIRRRLRLFVMRLFVRRPLCRILYGNPLSHVR